MDFNMCMIRINVWKSLYIKITNWCPEEDGGGGGGGGRKNKKLYVFESQAFVRLIWQIEKGH